MRKLGLAPDRPIPGAAAQCRDRSHTKLLGDQPHAGTTGLTRRSPYGLFISSEGVVSPRLLGTMPPCSIVADATFPDDVSPAGGFLTNEGREFSGCTGGRE